ncbi:MAG: chemotaxis protein CheW [Gammaproteobacteria bacterium]|nr:chemotaxis protein CheW [Gammaproteobacteria bacterium]MBU1655314.1 chemotaxis protein CheW [Gammaproteobacteria bacterium]MBU1961459.1 chemotaxis protein CheW [Gammaproteobacteria bacterium]
MNESISSGSEVGRDAIPRQYLSFLLEDEAYAVDILRVREIRVWEHVTPIPNTAAFIKGVINLRGTLVPIIDLRERFGLDPRPYGPRTVVLVLVVADAGQERTMGLVVDGVSNVCTLAPDLISPPPDFGGAVHAEFITGLATLEGRMLILLDSDRLLNLAEIYAVGQVQQQANLDASPPPPSGEGD